MRKSSLYFSNYPSRFLIANIRHNGRPHTHYEDELRHHHRRDSDRDRDRHNRYRDRDRFGGGHSKVRFKTGRRR